MKYKLMIKTHMNTNLKYLCVTIKNNYHGYKGSGVYWKEHLKEHGNLVKTKLIFETDNKEEFSKVCEEKSIEYDIVNSKEWANLIIEHGGGEYLYDNNGKRLCTNNKKYMTMTDEEKEQWNNHVNTLNWYECSVCGARMTEPAFFQHKKCKKNENFKMIKFDIKEFKKQFILHIGDKK